MSQPCTFSPDGANVITYHTNEYVIQAIKYNMKNYKEDNGIFYNPSPSGAILNKVSASLSDLRNGNITQAKAFTQCKEYFPDSVTYSDDLTTLGDCVVSCDFDINCD